MARSRRRALGALATSCVATGGWMPGASAQSDSEIPAELDGKYQLVEGSAAQTGADAVDVVDVFWYGCPHCYAFLDVFEPYAAAPPSRVRVRRIPAVFRSSWEPHARAYYTAQLLGVEERLHRPLFESIHEDGHALDTQDVLRDRFADFGIAAEDFDRVYTSFAVDSRVHESTVVQQRLGVTGTPTVVVDARYRVTAGPVGGFGPMLAVVRAIVIARRALL